MKRIILPILAAAVLLASCRTVSTKSGTDETASLGSAVLTLVEDMLLAVGDECVTPSDLDSCLPSSYTAYSGYIPSYDEMKEKYLSSLSDIVNDGISSLFSPSILSGGEKMADNPYPYALGESITAALRDAVEDILVETLSLYLEEREDELEDLFSQSREAFGRVRKAYSALSSVSKGIYLPQVGEADLSDVVSTAVEKYFSLLEEEETRLRTNPLYLGRILYLEEDEI